MRTVVAREKAMVELEALNRRFKPTPKPKKKSLRGQGFRGNEAVVAWLLRHADLWLTIDQAKDDYLDRCMDIYNRLYQEGFYKREYMRSAWADAALPNLFKECRRQLGQTAPCE